MKEQLFELLYELSKRPYQKFFKKNTPWTIGIKELIHYPETSLGFLLSSFWLQHHFDLQAQLEDHDVYHVLTKTGISVSDEISMQFYLLGNGKKSLYLFLVVFFGCLFFLGDLKKYKTAYSRGKNSFSFHQIDFSKLLHYPVEEIKTTFSIQ